MKELFKKPDTVSGGQATSADERTYHALSLSCPLSSLFCVSPRGQLSMESHNELPSCIYTRPLTTNQKTEVFRANFRYALFDVP
jgi:hypothetical protein